MKYIIMCGGNYKDKFETLKPLLEVRGEKLVERTIRLLKENGITDIAISTHNPAYNYLNVPILQHENNYTHDNPERHTKSKNSWLNAYYPTEESACYLPGDVYYSDEAIKTIIDTPVRDTMFFCIRDLCDGRPTGINIKGREPLAYKVENQKVFRRAINELFKMIDNGNFTSDPISWNLYRKINNLPLDYNGYGNDIFRTKGNFKVIDDYTTDIDAKDDILKLEKLLKILKGEIKMVKVEAIKTFYLGKFNELKDIVRKSTDEYGRIFIGDVFVCTEEMAKYLMNEEGYKNPANEIFIKIIEVIPETKKTTEEINTINPIEEKVKRTRRKKSTSID